MKRTFPVRIHTLKIEPDKDGYRMRHVYLMLPNLVDLNFFRQAHRIATAKKPKPNESVEFTVTVEDRSTGEVLIFEHWNSKGSRTKDFVLCAHLVKPYDPTEAMDHLLASMDSRDIELTIELETPLFPESRIEKVFTTKLSGDDFRGQA